MQAHLAWWAAARPWGETLLLRNECGFYPIESSTLDGRALAANGAVTYNASLGSLPTPEPPRFTRISRTNSLFATVVVTTTPYFRLTLETCPDLLLTNWTALTTDTPVISAWTNTDYTATVSQRFYRASLLMP